MKQIGPVLQAAQQRRQEVQELFERVDAALAKLHVAENLKCDIRLIDELRTRLGQLLGHYTESLRLNDEILSADLGLPWYDPDKRALVHRVNGEVEVLFHIESEGPLEHLGNIASFAPGSKSPDEQQPRPTAEAEKKMASAVDAFYYSASMFWDLIEKEYARKSKIKYIGVKKVRNELIEHVKPGVSYCYAATDHAGPVVRPERSAEAVKVPHDFGLVPNTYEMLSKTLLRLSS